MLNHAARNQQAKQRVENARADLNEAIERQDTVRQQARGISQSYHPFDLETAEVRDATTVEQDINQHFDAIEEAASEAGISGKCWALLQKARRLVPKMVATITFVHTKIDKSLGALDNASQQVKDALRDYLIPLLYLKEVARKATTADARDVVLRSCQRLQQRSGQAIAVLEALDPQTRACFEQVARICAQFFQRSSSNVEGRNGFLALRHHSLHHLGPRKLRALTVIHSFFEQSHDDLFQYLLLTLPPPKRPAARRAAAPSTQRVLN